MELIQILDCSATLNNCCSSFAIANVLDITRKIFDLVQMLVPIVLILMATVQFVQLTINPELKDGFRRVLNKIVAAFIIFLLPVLLDAVMGLVPGNLDVSACWKAAKATAANSSNTTARYIASDDEDENITSDDSSNKNTVIVKPKTVDTKVNEVKNNESKKSDSNKSSNSNGVSRESLVNYAKKFIGGKYNYDGKWNGESPYTPTNCVRFIKGVYKHHGITITGASHELINNPNVHKISEKEARAGDIVVYKVKHSAMLTGNGKQIIHDTSAHGVTMYSNYNYKKVKYFLRVDGVQ